MRPPRVLGERGLLGQEMRGGIRRPNGPQRQTALGSGSSMGEHPSPRGPSMPGDHVRDGDGGFVVRVEDDERRNAAGGTLLIFLLGDIRARSQQGQCRKLLRGTAKQEVRGMPLAYRGDGGTQFAVAEKGGQHIGAIAPHVTGAHSVTGQVHEQAFEPHSSKRLCHGAHAIEILPNVVQDDAGAHLTGSLALSQA